MRLSTKGRYGLKAMFDLAMNYGDTPVSLTTIAARQGVSVNYLEQLISPLRKAGFVKSVRGAQGGYLLSVDPGELTVKEILVVLEGPLAPTDCVKDETDSSCDKADYCVTRLIYEKMKESIDQVVSSITLKDMLEDHYRMTEQNKNVDEYFKCL